MNSAHTTRAQALDWLAGQGPAMQDFLQQLVNIDSGSRDEAGVTAVAQAIASHLAGAGITAQLETVPGYGSNLRADVPGTAGGAPILLTGHMDTVYPQGTVAQRPFRMAEGRAYGPGVDDMKAGLVLN
ncbi:MAG: Carboxypeptidase G2 [Paracidovorax wautersii]|uniref:Carboxypeptidase G2 n=1 Tax=Paracidovorax wautersii TaxID=1177982 RepID=A0A7V8FLF3_9BURK|nr:MAG: Carboxypeptidase G2 [Paracidovorax wautersii]